MPMEMIILLNLFTLGCLVPLVQRQTGQLSPPTNVSLSWVTEFCYKLSWSPPVENQTCIYELGESRLQNTLKYKYAPMEGGLLNLSLSAICGNQHSATVYPSLAFPELVRDFKCALHSNYSFNCTWLPTKQVVDLHLYYWKNDLFGNSSNDNCATTFDLAECPMYQSDANGTKTGCAMRGIFIGYYMYFLFNSTIDGTLARNTFQRIPSDYIEPPALNWTGVEDYDHHKLTISWTPVNILNNDWEYILNYTECGKRKIEQMSYGTNKKVLTLGHCEYNITMKAKRKLGNGETLPGQQRVYGKYTNTDIPLVLASTLIPAALVVILVVALVCFRRYNDSIFPKVPAPQDFLPDMLNNNNGLIPEAMYVPAQEEEPQNVTFLINPESSSDWSS
ncbi:unnamed protein product [Lota lota]